MEMNELAIPMRLFGTALSARACTSGRKKALVALCSRMGHSKANLKLALDLFHSHNIPMEAKVAAWHHKIQRQSVRFEIAATTLLNATENKKIGTIGSS